ncbi:MAG: glycoside hydrolase family 16 protein, partial [Limisphaerales bacterium]
MISKCRFLAVFATILVIELLAVHLRAGWNLVWDDEFNGTAIDSNHWTFETGNHHGWGNNELECYTRRPQNA